MATGGDNNCLPLKFITDIVKSLVVYFSPLTLILAGKRRENPYLPPEIIINILKRLRVKSLFRFQCVCKDWRNLLKSPSFITEHHHHSALNNRLYICLVFHLDDGYSPLCLLRCEKETVQFERLPAMDYLSRVSALIGSSNGLLCVKLDYFKHDRPPLLGLMNPATREVRKVPLSIMEDDTIDIYCQYFGFGYSPVDSDYKIVRIHPSNSNRATGSFSFFVDRVEVFSLRTRSWKEVEFGFTQTVTIKYSKSATANGTIFWLGLEEDSKSHDTIVSFDLATEVFTLIPIPIPIPSSTSITPIHLNLLDVHNNKVAMQQRYHAHGYTFIELWVLEEGSCAYGKSWGWTKRHSIRSTSLVPSPRCFSLHEIISIIDNSGFLLNVTTNDEFKKFRNPFSISDITARLFYEESLVSMRNIL